MADTHYPKDPKKRIDFWTGQLKLAEEFIRPYMKAGKEIVKLSLEIWLSNTVKRAMIQKKLNGMLSRSLMRSCKTKKILLKIYGKKLMKIARSASILLCNAGSLARRKLCGI